MSELNILSMILIPMFSSIPLGLFISAIIKTYKDHSIINWIFFVKISLNFLQTVGCIYFIFKTFISINSSANNFNIYIIDMLFVFIFLTNIISGIVLSKNSLEFQRLAETMDFDSITTEYFINRIENRYKIKMFFIFSISFFALLIVTIINIIISLVKLRLLGVANITSLSVSVICAVVFSSITIMFLISERKDRSRDLKTILRKDEIKKDTFLDFENQIKTKLKTLNASPLIKKSLLNLILPIPIIKQILE